MATIAGIILQINQIFNQYFLTIAFNIFCRLKVAVK